MDTASLVLQHCGYQSKATALALAWALDSPTLLKSGARPRFHTASQKSPQWQSGINFEGKERAGGADGGEEEIHEQRRDALRRRDQGLQRSRHERRDCHCAPSS